jgi:hypothetical protein
MWSGQPRIGRHCLLQPPDRLVCARFQEVNHTDPPAPIGKPRVPRAETDGLFRLKKAWGTLFAFDVCEMEAGLPKLRRLVTPKSR